MVSILLREVDFDKTTTSLTRIRNKNRRQDLKKKPDDICSGKLDSGELDRSVGVASNIDGFEQSSALRQIKPKKNQTLQTLVFQLEKNTIQNSGKNKIAEIALKTQTQTYGNSGVHIRK